MQSYSGYGHSPKVASANQGQPGTIGWKPAAVGGTAVGVGVGAGVATGKCLFKKKKKGFRISLFYILKSIRRYAQRTAQQQLSETGPAHLRNTTE